MATLKDVQDAQAEELVKIDKVATDVQALKDKIASGGQITMADLDGLVASAKAGSAAANAARASFVGVL